MLECPTVKTKWWFAAQNTLSTAAAIFDMTRHTSLRLSTLNMSKRPYDSPQSTTQIYGCGSLIIITLDMISELQHDISSKHLLYFSFSLTIITQRSSVSGHAAVAGEALPLLETNTLVTTGILLTGRAGPYRNTIRDQAPKNTHFITLIM